MKHLVCLHRAYATLLTPLAFAATLAFAPPAMAQSEFKYGQGNVYQKEIEDLINTCRPAVETFIAQTLAAPDYNGNGQGYGTITPQQADLDKDGRFDRKDPVAIINSQMIVWLMDVRNAAAIHSSLSYHESTLTGAGYVDANVIQTVEARLDLIRCLYGRRVAQLEGAAVAPSAAPTPAASTPAPAATATGNTLGAYVLPYPDSTLGPETQKALSGIMAPEARSGRSFYDQTDFTALAEGRPSNPASKKDQAAANANYNATKTRKLHNRLNDVTPCLAVDPTGVREEWGMEGRFRIRNTCSFPVEASWCANKKECESGHGSLWKLPPKATWPIFFADVANPMIGIGGCRTDETKRPLPSDAAINAAGGINTSHKQPMPYPGVAIMPGHRCD